MAGIGKRCAHNVKLNIGVPGASIIVSDITVGTITFIGHLKMPTFFLALILFINFSHSF